MSAGLIAVAGLAGVWVSGKALHAAARCYRRLAKWPVRPARHVAGYTSPWNGCGV